MRTRIISGSVRDVEADIGAGIYSLSTTIDHLSAAMRKGNRIGLESELNWAVDAFASVRDAIRALELCRPGLPRRIKGGAA